MNTPAPAPVALLRQLGTATAVQLAQQLGRAPEDIYPDLVAAEARGSAYLVTRRHRALWVSRKEFERCASKHLQDDPLNQLQLAALRCW